MTLSTVSSAEGVVGGCTLDSNPSWIWVALVMGFQPTNGGNTLSFVIYIYCVASYDHAKSDEHIC